MTAYSNTITLQLVAANATGLALSQTLASAGNLTLNGALVSSSVGTFDVARRVGIFSYGNDTALTWTIAGTDRKGISISETMAGGFNSTAQTVRDFKTVTKISGSAATAGNVIAGSTLVGSSAPIVVDYFANPFSLGYSISTDDIVNIEVTNDDFSPMYDVNTTTPNWIAQVSGATGPSNGQITGPVTMVRLTIISGTDPAVLRLTQGLIGGGA